jgi:hypothetical protein
VSYTGKNFNSAFLGVIIQNLVCAMCVGCLLYKTNQVCISEGGGAVK